MSVSLAVTIARKIMVRVRSGDLDGGRLRPGRGHDILRKVRDMNLRGLAEQMKVPLPPEDGESKSRATRPGDSDVEMIQRQRIFSLEAPQVNLGEILDDAGVAEDTIAQISVEELLFNVLRQPSDRSDLFLRLDNAARSALFNALDKKNCAALFREIGAGGHVIFFSAMRTLDRFTFILRLDHDDRFVLFRSLGTEGRIAMYNLLKGEHPSSRRRMDAGGTLDGYCADLAAEPLDTGFLADLKEAVAGDSRLALAFAIIEQQER